MTLRARFAVWVSLLLLVALVGFGAFIYATVAAWLAGSVDDSLRLSATQVIETIDVERGRIDLSESPVVQDSGLADELRARGVSIQVMAPDGAVIRSVGPYRGLPLEPAALASVLRGQAALVTRPDPAGTGRIRVYTQAMFDRDAPIGIIQISESLRETGDALNELMTALLVASPILVLAAGLGGYLLAGRALAPIDQITTTANRISAEDLGGRLNLPQTRDEVGRLAATFDRMLGRLEEGFRRERQFTSDAAHQLRTPLAAMHAILAVTAQRPRTTTEYTAALGDLSEETARLSSLTDDLLALARAEGATPAREPVDLGTLLPDITESVRPLAELKGLRLEYAGSGELGLQADADQMVQLFVALLDNAIKFTAKGGVTVSATGDADAVTVAVADTGPGVDAAHVPHLFERFYRVDATGGTPGTGLGLAIANGIARAHGGAIDVHSEPGRGSRFTVRLPRR
jgi:heavy metal sensor kinase